MSVLPEQMTAAVLQSPGVVTVESRPVPHPGPDEVLIKVSSVGVCGSDVHYFDHGRIGDFVVEAPMVLGHEASGTIVAAGSPADAGRIGERVAIEPQTTCGVCEQCVRGRYNLCPSVIFYATPPVDGAFAGYVIAPTARAHAVPDSLDDDEAALIEPLAVAVWANQKAQVQPGDVVIVSGAGPVGLLCLQVANARGAGQVIVTDINEDRLAVAAELGASRTINLATDALGDASASVVIECTGAQAAIDSSIRSVAPGATIVLVGMAAQVTLPLDVLQSRELWVTGTFRYAHAYPTAIQLAASGKINLKALVTSHWSLDHVDEALVAGRVSPAALKAMVNPWR